MRLAVILVVGAVLSGGCVEREIQIRSLPAGARVYLDGEYVGLTPCTSSFEFYGTREIELRKPGYKVVRRLERVSAPAYGRFPLDLFSEVLSPARLRDVHGFSYPLEPLPPEGEAEGLYRRALEFGHEGEAVESESGGEG